MTRNPDKNPTQLICPIDYARFATWRCSCRFVSGGLRGLQNREAWSRSFLDKESVALILRILLMTLAISALLLAPEQRAQTILSWPAIMPTLIAPTVAPLILLMLIIDLVMTKIMSAGETNAKKQARARWIMGIDALVAAGIVYAYLPFFLTLGR